MRVAIVPFSLMALASLAPAVSPVKLAFFNIQSGKGEVWLPGRAVLFTDTQHCTDAEGFTGMTNRKGCGSPAGYTWKRIDYAWSSPGFIPTDITRFAVPETPGDAAASDHYGIVATYPMPSAQK